MPMLYSEYPSGELKPIIADTCMNYDDPYTADTCSNYDDPYIADTCVN